jgi:hypothetical protein
MRLSDDVKQQICAWYQANYDAAFNEELEELIMLGQCDPSYDREAMTPEEFRQCAKDHVIEDFVLGRLFDRSEWDVLEYGILEAVLNNELQREQGLRAARNATAMSAPGTNET